MGVKNKEMKLWRSNRCG